MAFHLGLCSILEFISRNMVKRHIYDVKNLRPEHGLPISVKHRVILLYRESFVFTKLRICEVSRK